MLRLSASLGISAKSGAASGSAPAPDAPPGTPTAWWKADALGLANNDPVATWSDSAGSTDLTTLLGGPVFKTNIVNAKPIVRLNGVDDVMDSGVIAWQAPITISIVAKMTGDGSTAPTIISGGSDKISLYGADSGANTIRGGVNTDAVLANTAVPMSAFHCMTAIFANSGSGFWLDGVSTSPASDLVGASDLVTQVLLGFGPADVAEIVIYNNQALGSTDRAALDSYLMAKYGLA